MRDVNRIDKILEEVGKIWKKHPDLRLGQLLLNVARDPVLLNKQGLVQDPSL